MFKDRIINIFQGAFPQDYPAQVILLFDYLYLPYPDKCSSDEGEESENCSCSTDPFGTGSTDPFGTGSFHVILLWFGN